MHHWSACLPSVGWWRWLNQLMWPDGRGWYLWRFLRCCCLVLCRDTKAPAGVRRAGFWRIGESLRSGIRAAVALHPQEVSCRDAYRLAECDGALPLKWMRTCQRSAVRALPARFFNVNRIAMTESSIRSPRLPPGWRIFLWWPWIQETHGSRW